MSADCSHIVATNLRCDACGASLGVYPGEEPCVCGDVTIDGHYLSVTVADGDSDVHHYRRSDDAPCEASVTGRSAVSPTSQPAQSAPHAKSCRWASGEQSDPDPAQCVTCANAPSDNNA